MSIEENKKDIYTEEGREIAEEEDEITNVEEGFMEGYEEGESAAKCSTCKKILEDDFIEEDFKEGSLKFCSEECATKYEKYNK
jgi:flagellar biosynthesis/type III secretory pathway protein FliH